MTKNKSFWEMHEAVGGSYSSPERAQQEQEWTQKRQKKTAEIYRQTLENSAKRTEERRAAKQEQAAQQDTEREQSQKATTPSKSTSTAVKDMNQLLTAAIAVKKGQDPIFAKTNAAVQREKEEKTSQNSVLEQTIKGLQNQKKPGGMGTYQGTTDYNAGIQKQIDKLQNQIDTSKQEAADLNDYLIAAMPEEDKKALENYVNQRRTDWYNTLLQGVYGNGVIGTPGMQAELQVSALAEKYGWDTVKSLAETLERQQSAQATAWAQQVGSEIGNEHPFLGSAASIPMNVLSGIPATFERIRGITTSTGDYPSLDPNNVGNLLGTMGSSIQGQVASKIEGDGSNPWRKTGSYVYRGGMSALESGLRAATGKAGTVLLSGLGSFEQNVAKASAQGASPEKAFTLGLTNAAIEALSEEIPLDNLLNAAKGGKQSFTKALGLALAQAGIEASTEEVSLIGTTLAEAAILKDKSEFNQYIQSRMAEGADYQTAYNEAMQDIIDEAIDTAIVSGISGAGMSGVNSIVTNYKVNKAAKKQGSSQTVANAQPDTNGETDSDAQQAPQQVTEAPLQGEPADPRQLARQKDEAQEVAQAMEQEQQAQAAQQEAPQAPAAADPLLENIQTPVAPAPEQAPQQTTAGREQLDRAIAETLAQNQGQQQNPLDTDPLGTQLSDAEFIDAMTDRAAARDPRNGIADPMADRDASEVGKRNVKAYQYENPEVKPFFAEEALQMSAELQDTVRAERTYNDNLYYESGGEKGYTGNSRLTSDSIATLRDDYGLSYDQIQKGLFDIINDQGSENNAAAKRIELVLNDRLMNGYKDFYTGKRVAPNQGYLDFLRSSQSQESSRPQTATPNSPGIKGIGAAEANFTGKAGYYDLLSDQNSQPDRASDVRPMELPKTDINGNPVSEVTGNAYASKFTPDEFASLMEEPTARGDFSYVKITNDQAAQRAIDTISAAGDWETAYNQWAKDVGSGKAGAEMSARGALFLNHFAQEGNKTQWLNTLADMQDLGTNTAQGLQAMRLLRELNPPDKIRFVEMTTKRLGKKMGIDFTVDQSLYDAYNNATTDEARSAALDNIEQAVADQIPSTALDKWNALRYTNMLGNLKTNMRNIAGNVGAGAMYRVKDQISTTMEGVLYKATGGKFERTKSHTVSKELLNACKQDFDQVSGIVSDGGKYGTQGGFSDQFTQGVMDKRSIFKSDNKVIDTLLKPLEGYRKATDWMMNNQYFGDEAFGKAAYARSLAGYLKVHGVTDTDLSKVDTGLMDKARAYAVQEAQEATFHDNSALARTMSKLKKDTGVIGEGIMPFTKTPANVLTRAEEFSPLGFFNTLYKTTQKELSKTNLVNKRGVLGNIARSGVDVTGVDLVNSLSKSLTGAGIFALGAWLRNQGFLTGGPDGDEDKDYFDQLNGDQNYALRFTINGKTYNYTFDWLTPAAMPLFMGGQFMDIMNQGFENITFADLEKVFTSIADPMLQMSMLQSLNDSLDNIKYTDNNLGQFFINAAVSYLTQGFANTMLGQIERSTEKNRMTTYVDKDSQVPAWMQRQLGSLSQKTPGWDYHQVEYRNAWGEPEENEGGLLYNLLSPGYISEEKSNALSEELYRLNDAGVEGNVFPDTPATTVSYTDKNGDRHEDYNLTAAEADTLKEVSGRTSATLLGDLIESDMYNAMTDQQKADVVSTVYDYARELGRTEAIEGYNGMDSWMEGLGDNAADTILNKVVTSSFSDSFTSLVNSWNYGKDTGSAISDLDQAYSLYTTLSEEGQKQFREENGGRIGYFLTAKEAGVSTERFADLYSTYRTLDKNEDLSTQEKALQWSNFLAKAQKSGQITSKQKEALKNSMVFRQSYVAETEKYDNLVDNGMSPDSANSLMYLMDGIQGTGKDGYVRDIDKYSAIAGSSLSAKDKETALYEYMSDVMDKKYTYAKRNMGLTVDDFVKAYKVTDKYSLKDDQKEAWKAMGYTEAEAENLWQLYKGNLT